MKDFTRRLADLGYGAAWAGLRHLPHRPTLAAANVIADRAFRRRGPAVIQYARNLRRVLVHGAPDGSEPAAGIARRVDPAELSATVKAGLRSYARYWVETFQLPGMDLAEVAGRAEAGTTGLEHVRAAVEEGRGAIIALPHSGNWDVAGLMICRIFGSLTSVAERLQPDSLYEKFVAYRQLLGMEILPLTGPGAAATSGLLKERLRAGQVVCLLGDRDLGGSGVPVDFFGERTRMPAGPAMLAALTGAALLPTHLSYNRHGWRNVIGPPLSLPGTRLAEQVRTGTQLLADRYAAGIAGAPADWHMLQPLWPGDMLGGGR